MRSIFLIVVVLSSFLLQAQKISVSGKAENQSHQLIRLIAYDDQFSMFENTLSSVYSSSDGSFSLETELNETQIVLISLNLKKGEIVVEPEKSYELEILEDTSGKGKSIYEQNALQYEIIGKSVLNTQLQEFNVKYNTFLLKNFNSIYRSRNNSIINGFKSEMDSVFHDYENVYFKNYLTYKIASLELGSRKKDENKLIEEYFLNKEILYTNIEYTSLFKEVFDNYLISGLGGIDFSNLMEIINYSANFKKIDDAISMANPILSSNKQLRELIAIVGLVKIYNRQEFSNKNIISLLKQVERNSVFSENGKIAGNYVKKLRKLAYGTMAKDFELIDQYGEKFVLAKQTEKFVLLGFMQDDCGICISQISLLDELRQTFKGELQNISIVSGGNISEITNFMEARNYNWPVLKLDDILLLEAYDIKVFPTYVLINPDGSIAMAPTPMPDENLAIFINGFMKRWKTK